MPAREIEGAIRDLQRPSRRPLPRIRRAGSSALPACRWTTSPPRAGDAARAASISGWPARSCPGNFFLTLEDAERLRPVFAAANDGGALLMVHPGLMPGELPPPPMPTRHPARLGAEPAGLDRPDGADARRAARCSTISRTSRSKSSISAARCPSSSSGSYAVARRADGVSRRAPAAMVYDTASLGPRAIETAARVLGADRLMLGTDYPIFQPASPAGRPCGSCGWTRRSSALIRQRTAATLLRRLGVLA